VDRERILDWRRQRRHRGNQIITTTPCSWRCHIDQILLDIIHCTRSAKRLSAGQNHFHRAVQRGDSALSAALHLDLSRLPSADQD
jgi:hypothetical protein